MLSSMPAPQLRYLWLPVLEQNPQIRPGERQQPSWPENRPATTEIDPIAVGHVERELSARVPAGPYLHGVMSRLDRHLDGLSVIDRVGAAAIDPDLEPAAPQLDAEGFPAHPERC